MCLHRRILYKGGTNQKPRVLKQKKIKKKVTRAIRFKGKKSKKTRSQFVCLFYIILEFTLLSLSKNCSIFVYFAD